MGRTSKSRHWCINKKCGRKRVIHYPLSIFEKDYKKFKDKPFICSECKKRFSHAEMGLVRGGDYKYVFSKGNKELCQRLRQHCIIVSMQKRRQGLI